MTTPTKTMVTSDYRDSWINPRFKVAALWGSMVLLYAYVDLFGLFRADVRADIEAGRMFAFTIGQGFLLGATLYVALPALMVSLSLVLPIKVLRVVSLVLAVVYALTVAGSAVGEWTYYLLGSAIEVALLATIGWYAWRWPKAPAAEAPPAREEGLSRRAV